MFVSLSVYCLQTIHYIVCKQICLLLINKQILFVYKQMVCKQIHSECVCLLVCISVKMNL